MAQTLIVLAHPKSDSFCAAMAGRVRNSSPDSILRDLYSENFNPVLDAIELAGKGSLDPVVQEHQRLLSEARRLVLVFPDWWGSMPAILKGWVDRVWRPGIAYSSVENSGGEPVTEGLLGRLEISLVVASDSESPFIDAPATAGRKLSGFARRKPGGLENDPVRIAANTHPIVAVWRDSVAAFSGARLTSILWCGPLRDANYSRRQEWLELAEKSLLRPRS